jgi:hypothetical protein
MQHPTHRLVHVVALVSIAALCLGNGCASPTSEGGTGGSGGTAGSGGASGAGGTAGSGGSTFDDPIEGTYVELFSCQLDDRTCLEVNVRIEMEVRHLGEERYEIDDLGSKALATGTRGNNTILNWTNMDPDFPGFTESGSWVFIFGSDPSSTTFTKTSVFMQDQGMSGSCIGNGSLEGEPDPLPAFMPPCIPQ